MSTIRELAAIHGVSPEAVVRPTPPKWDNGDPWPDQDAILDVEQESRTLYRIAGLLSCDRDQPPKWAQAPIATLDEALRRRDEYKAARDAYDVAYREWDEASCERLRVAQMCMRMDSWTAARSLAPYRQALDIAQRRRDAAQEEREVARLAYRDAWTRLEWPYTGPNGGTIRPGFEEQVRAASLEPQVSNPRECARCPNAHGLDWPTEPPAPGHVWQLASCPRCNYEDALAELRERTEALRRQARHLLTASYA